MIAKVDVVGRSDEEIMSTFKTNPSALSLEELLYAGGKLTNDLAPNRLSMKRPLNFSRIASGLIITLDVFICGKTNLTWLRKNSKLPRHSKKQIKPNPTLGMLHF
jgi:hypothetical protein